MEEVIKARQFQREIAKFLSKPGTYIVDYKRKRLKVVIEDPSKDYSPSGGWGSGQGSFEGN